jgi:hypothetical protein
MKCSRKRSMRACGVWRGQTLRFPSRLPPGMLRHPAPSTIPPADRPCRPPPSQSITPLSRIPLSLRVLAIPFGPHMQFDQASVTPDDSAMTKEAMRPGVTVDQLSSQACADKAAWHAMRLRLSGQRSMPAAPLISSPSFRLISWTWRVSSAVQ